MRGLGFHYCKYAFELIDEAFKALLKSQPDKIADLRDKFRDALPKPCAG